LARLPNFVSTNWAQLPNAAPASEPKTARRKLAASPNAEPVNLAS
jgi:hypothetical protein